MSTTQVAPSSAAPAEVLIKEARRRQRRRWAATVLLLLAAAGATWLALSGSGGGARPAPRTPSPHAPPANVRSAPASTIPRRVGTTLVLWTNGRSFVDDLGTRQSSSRAPVLRSIGYRDYQPLAAAIGNKFVFVGRGLSVSGRVLTGQPRRLSSSPTFAPAAGSDHVWVVSSRRHTHVARLTSLRTGATSRAVPLPPETTLVRGTNAGLLLHHYAAHVTSLTLWRPGTAPMRLPYAPAWGDGFSATARLVAYGTGCRILSPKASYEPDACHMLRVLDVVTGRVASYPSPPRTLGWVPFEFNLVDAISPSGKRLAAVAATSPRHEDHGRLYTVPLTHSGGRPTRVPGSAGSVRSRVAWSAHGDWLFYQGPSRNLQAFQVSTGRVRTSSTPCCQYTVMAAVPDGH